MLYLCGEASGDDHLLLGGVFNFLLGGVWLDPLLLGGGVSFKQTLSASISGLNLIVGAQVLLVQSFVDGFNLEVYVARRATMVVFLEMFSSIFRKMREFLRM